MKFLFCDGCGELRNAYELEPVDADVIGVFCRECVGTIHSDDDLMFDRACSVYVEHLRDEHKKAMGRPEWATRGEFLLDDGEPEGGC